MYSGDVASSQGAKRARRLSEDYFDDSHLALDAVDSNPHPTTPFVLSDRADSPRSSAFLFLSSRANSSPPSFWAEQAAITETNHFLDTATVQKLSIPAEEFRAEQEAAITETNHFETATMQKLSPIPAEGASFSPPMRTDNRRDGLVRTLLAELQEERSARLALQDEVARLKKLLREREREEEGGGEDRAAASRNAPPGQKQRAGNDIAKLSAQPTPFRTIPIVDLSLPLADVVFDIGRACRLVGFFYVVNHGVEASLISDAMSFSRKFFDLPSATKLEVDSANSRSGARGYFSLGGEDLNAKDGTRDLVAEGQAVGNGTSRAFRGDWKEGYDCGREISPSDEEYGLSSMMDCNHWPREEVLPGFREAMLAYQKGALSLAAKIMKGFAIGLGVSSDYFKSRTEKPMATLRLLHYPPQPEQNLSELDQIGCGAHTDYGLCTLLLQDSVGGLQVRNAAGEWVEAPPMPGSFVVNVGDMLSRWTNGRYASTVHRVVNLSGEERYSIPLFVNPDAGIVVDCLPTCLNEGESPRFAPEASHVILSKRYRGSFVHMKAGNEN